MRRGPLREPWRSASSDSASARSRMMRTARTRKAAPSSVSEPHSATLTKVEMPSSFTIVRLFRKVDPGIGGYSGDACYPTLDLFPRAVQWPPGRPLWIEESILFKFITDSALAMALALPAFAEVQPFPAFFQAKEVAVEGAALHVVVGGHGPAVVPLHGFGDTGAMWSRDSRANSSRSETIVSRTGYSLAAPPAGFRCGSYASGSRNGPDRSGPRPAAAHDAADS